MRVDAMEGGGVGAGVGGAAGSLMRLMTFSESCKVEQKVSDNGLKKKQ